MMLNDFQGAEKADWHSRLRSCQGWTYRYSMGPFQEELHSVFFLKEQDGAGSQEDEEW